MSTYLIISLPFYAYVMFFFCCIICILAFYASISSFILFSGAGLVKLRQQEIFFCQYYVVYVSSNCYSHAAKARAMYRGGKIYGATVFQDNTNEKDYFFWGGDLALLFFYS